MEGERQSERPAAARGSALAISAAMVALGLLVLYQGAILGSEQGYARIGPQAFPYIIGAGIVVIGLFLARDAFRGAWPIAWIETDDPARSAKLRQIANVAFVGIGLAANAALIGPLGFVVASTVMFALTTRAFGSRRFVFDLLVGAAFAGFIFVTFTWGLGIPLPAGTLWSGR
jgi:putative tricarboxylic transport membrane protein